MPATYTIQVRRGTAAEWTASNPILSSGEFGYETDSKRIKVGDGTAAWSSLAYISPGPNSVVAATDIASLTSPQQTSIVVGTLVTTSDGRRWIYSGSGSKTSEASYVELADVTPAWATIANKPTTLSGYGITDAAAADHAHGNILGGGTLAAITIPSQQSQPVAYSSLVGSVGRGAWGSAAGTFCQGNDARLSDARTPTSHASTHATGGSDAVAPVIQSPSQLTSSQNNFNPGACDILRLTSSVAVDITGMAAPSSDGTLRLVINTNAANGAAITLKHLSGSSDAPNQFRSSTAGDVILLADGGSALLTYSTAISRWRVL